MPQQVNPWFDPNSPITTFGAGAQNTMQGMYAAAMLKRQQDEAARQFNMTQALEQQKQDWTQTNTPAHQFGEMTDVTRDKWGNEIPLQDVQENYFKQFAPKYEPTLEEQAKAMVENGGARDMADAYDKLQKVGRYNIYNTPSRAGVPSAETVQYQDAAKRYAAGEFGPVGDPESFRKFQEFFERINTNPSLNRTPPKMLGEHKAIVGSAAKNVAETLKVVDAELKSITGKPELYDDQGEPLPMEGAEKTGGFLGIGGSVKQWPPFYAKRFKLLEEHRSKLSAAMKFIQFVQDMVEGGSALPPNVVNWVNQVINYPQAILENEAVLQAIPKLQEEISQAATPGIGQ